MALWLVRAGRHGEHEARFLEDGFVYLTWRQVPDLSQLEELDEFDQVLGQVAPEFGANKRKNHASQMMSFAHRMETKDWVILPSKHAPSIHIGEVLGNYEFDGDADEPFYRHRRPVKWFAADVPRSSFDQDLLYSFGAFLTVCQIKRNDAEARIRAMASSGWKAPDAQLDTPTSDEQTGVADDRDQIADIRQVARDQIAQLIQSRFMGHAMERLVQAILEAQGYTTHRSPEGADKGVDLLAAPGPMGFGQPRICVQVKSSRDPVDRPTLDQLIGTMQNVSADQGLLVGWGGFKSSVQQVKASQFFRVRLWNQDDLIDELLENYEALDDDIKAQLPLVRIWTVAPQDDDEP